MLITQADYHNGRGTQSTSAITGKSTNKSETAIISETGVKRSVLFKENRFYMVIFLWFILLCNKERTNFGNRTKKKMFGNAVDRWSKKISKRDSGSVLDFLHQI